jgi:hypothetical protein
MRLQRLLGRRPRGRHAAPRGAVTHASRHGVLELPQDFVVQPAASLPRQRVDEEPEGAAASLRPARRGPTITPG